MEMLECFFAIFQTLHLSTSILLWLLHSFFDNFLIQKNIFIGRKKKSIQNIYILNQIYRRVFAVR